MVFKQIPFAEMFFEQILFDKNVNQSNAYLHKCFWTNACLQNIHLDKCPFTQMLIGQTPIHQNVIQTNA